MVRRQVGSALFQVLGRIDTLASTSCGLQEALRKNEFSLLVLETLLNCADVGTKSLETDRLDSLMLQMQRSRGERRTAAVAFAALSFLSASSPTEQRGVLTR